MFRRTETKERIVPRVARLAFPKPLPRITPVPFAREIMSLPQSESEFADGSQNQATGDHVASGSFASEPLVSDPLATSSFAPNNGGSADASIGPSEAMRYHVQRLHARGGLGEVF